jgi:hypothetical protein
MVVKKSRIRNSLKATQVPVTFILYGSDDGISKLKSITVRTFLPYLVNIKQLCYFNNYIINKNLNAKAKGFFYATKA